MSRSTVLLLTGAPGSGKSTLGNELQQRTGATVATIDDYRDRYGSQAWNRLAATAKATAGPLIVECCRPADELLAALGNCRVVHCVAPQNERAARLTKRGWTQDHVARAVNEQHTPAATATVVNTTGATDFDALASMLTPTNSTQPNPGGLTMPQTGEQNEGTPDPTTATTDGEMTPDGPEPTPTADTDGQDSKVFDAEYVKTLRGEAAANRTKLRDAEARLKDFEDRDKTELEKLTERADDAEKRAAAAEVELLRARVASEAGLPTELAARLHGDTEDEMRADAEQLVKLVPNQGGPPPGSFDNGTAEPGSAQPSMDSLIRGN